jgi:hypothetical protein
LEKAQFNPSNKIIAGMGTKIPYIFYGWENMQINPFIVCLQMHSVGFYHEHERWDRDKYLVILWQNIDRG